jgi:hypothetical protein
MLVEPFRVLDTRFGTRAPGHRLGPAEAVDVDVAGCGPVPADAAAVIVNVTAVHPSASTFLTVAAPSSERPRVWSMHARRGHLVAHECTVALRDGRLAVFNQCGEVDVVIDLIGYYLPDPRATLSA